MNIKVFDNLLHFRPSENWGDIELLQWHHVHHLELIRKTMIMQGNDWPMIIHNSAATTGHSKDSYHYRGLATDFHFNTPISLFEQLQALKHALRRVSLFNYVGLGFYLDWRIPGFHLDSRGRMSRWMRIKHEYREYDERALV